MQQLLRKKLAMYKNSGAAAILCDRWKLFARRSSSGTVRLRDQNPGDVDFRFHV